MLGGIIVNILLAWTIYTLIFATVGQKYISTENIQKNGLAFDYLISLILSLELSLLERAILPARCHEFVYRWSKNTTLRHVIFTALRLLNKNID